MQASLCSRCGKRVAVVFITKLEGGVTRNEGLCLPCARELHIQPVEDMIKKMGISDEDLDTLSGEMMNALSGAEDLMNLGGEARARATRARTTARPPPSPSSTASSAVPAGRTPPGRRRSPGRRAREPLPSPPNINSWTITALI